MTLTEFAVALRAQILKLSKITSASQGKALAPAFTALADAVPGLLPAITERRSNSERRVATDVAGSPARRLGQRRLVSFQITVTV